MSFKCTTFRIQKYKFYGKNELPFLPMTEGEDVKANIRKLFTYEKSCYFHIDNLDGFWHFIKDIISALRNLGYNQAMDLPIERDVNMCESHGTYLPYLEINIRQKYCNNYVVYE
jgi:hypothetical protein